MTLRTTNLQASLHIHPNTITPASASHFLPEVQPHHFAAMASNTKYQPAPQQDPDDYTQAPPAYAEGSSSRDEQQGLFGPPRSSEDNLPDDFKVRNPFPLITTLITNTSQFGGSVAEATVDIRNQFVRKVYTILTVQLIATGAVSGLTFFSDTYRTWIQSHPGVVWISVRFSHSAPRNPSNSYSSSVPWSSWASPTGSASPIPPTSSS